MFLMGVQTMTLFVSALVLDARPLDTRSVLHRHIINYSRPDTRYTITNCSTVNEYSMHKLNLQLKQHCQAVEEDVDDRGPPVRHGPKR